jgi:flagellar biosynthesis protein FlhF
VREAYRQVQRDMGIGAQVIHTRLEAGRWWQRLLGWRSVELWAATFDTYPATPPPLPGEGSDSGGVPPDRHPDPPPPSLDPQEVRRRLQPALPRVAAHCASSPLAAAAPWGDLEGESSAELLHQAFRQMVAAGVPEATARTLVQRVYDLESLDEMSDLVQVREAVGRSLCLQVQIVPPLAARPGEQLRVMVAGPGGSGKTSTLVKLAAHLRLEQGAQVALVSVDTFRLAAAEQLRAFAELLDVTCDVVTTPRELRQSLRQRKDADVVFIDTCARNPRDVLAMQQLGALVRQAEAQRIMLVLEATQHGGFLVDCAAAFAAQGATEIILTRLDQASRLGNLIPLLEESGLPLSYTTAGPNPCEDLAPASMESLLPRLLGGYTPVPPTARLWQADPTTLDPEPPQTDAIADAAGGGGQRGSSLQENQPMIGCGRFAPEGGDPHG